MSVLNQRPIEETCKNLDIIKAVRKAGSIAELARQLEVHLRTVNRWVRDDTPPSSLAQNRLWDYLK